MPSYFGKVTFSYKNVFFHLIHPKKKEPRIGFLQLEISEIAGCRKPCKYKKYSFLGEPYPSAFKSEHYIFSLWAVSNKTKVETEELIYPSSSLVAEFGGILSLFLGFSFISVWDNFSTLKRFLQK